MPHQIRLKDPSLATQVDQHQRAVLAVIARTLPLLGRRELSVAAGGELARARMEMGRLLMEYALFKHREIFAPILAAGDDRRNECLRVKTACIAAGQEYRDFIRSGNRADPVADWEAYRLAAHAMAQTMKAHLVEERAGIRRLLGVRTTKAIGEAPPPPPPPPPPGDESINVEYV